MGCSAKMFGFTLAQLHIAEQRRNKNAIKYYTQELKKIWIRENYPIMYDKAIEASTAINRNIWFDPRYWTSIEIKEFFEDLAYVNQDVWELVHIKMTQNIHSIKAHNRYTMWLNTKSSFGILPKKN